MPLRATNADVDALMDTTGVLYTKFITTANLIVDEELVGSGMSEARLTQIEIYLAAHFATLAKEKGGIRRYAVGESSESYASISERFSGFHTTRFGQQAVGLDTTGQLAVLADAGLRAEFRVV